MWIETRVIWILKSETPCRFFYLCDLEIGWMTLKNNRAPVLCLSKFYVSFHGHHWFNLELLSGNAQIWAIFFYHCDLGLWPCPFVWTLLSIVITPENFMMIQCQMDGWRRTDGWRWTDRLMEMDGWTGVFIELLVGAKLYFQTLSANLQPFGSGLSTLHVSCLAHPNHVYSISYNNWYHRLEKVTVTYVSERRICRRDKKIHSLLISNWSFQSTIRH